MNTFHILKKTIYGAQEGTLMECNVEAGKYTEICDCCGQKKSSCMQFYEPGTYDNILDLCRTCRRLYMESVEVDE